MAKMHTNNITVTKYKGENLRIEAMLNQMPLEEGEDIFRVNGPKGMRLMILPEDMGIAAVRQEYVKRYGTVEIEEELE